METKDLKNIAFESLKYISPLSYMIAKKVQASSEKSDKILQGDNINDMLTELKKKEIETKLRELEAKINQELAIAYRIENAIEVEIEEYYEGSGKGSAGLSATEKNITVGLSGEGRKVTKRIYKFKGLRPEIIEKEK